MKLRRRQKDFSCISPKTTKTSRQTDGAEESVVVPKLCRRKSERSTEFKSSICIESDSSKIKIVTEKMNNTAASKDNTSLPCHHQLLDNNSNASTKIKEKNSLLKSKKVRSLKKHSKTSYDSILLKEPSGRSIKDIESDLNISPCSVILSEEDDVSSRLSVSVSKNERTRHKAKVVHHENTSHHQSIASDSNMNDSTTSVEELMSLLEEEFGPVRQSLCKKNNKRHVAESRNVSKDCKSDDDFHFESNITTTLTVDKSFLGETNSRLKKVYTDRKSNLNIENKTNTNCTLSSWLATAQNSSEGDQSDRSQLLSKKIVRGTDYGTRMKDLNMHTPLEIRHISRLASTPQISSSSDTNCEEDLFGFENLLKPVVDLPRDFSPIPNPYVRKSHRVKKSPFYPEDKAKQFEGVLDITYSHFNTKKTRSRKGKKIVKNDKVIDLSDVHLFEDAVEEDDETDAKENNHEFAFEDVSPSKPKRHRQINKAVSAPHIPLDMQDQLQWKEIMEHELVIESV